MTAPRVLRNTDALLEAASVEGKAVLDVGCGDGSISRLLARAGARVVLGLEVSPKQIERYLAGEQLTGMAVLDSGAEDMPLPDGCMDMVVFFNSLHHIPVHLMGKALSEAARVVKADGLVYVTEPMAEGPLFEFLRPVDDETEVRAFALEHLHAADKVDLRLEKEEIHIHPARRRNYDSTRDAIIAANPERAAAFDALDAELRASFDRLGRPHPDGGVLFDQPTRGSWLRKAL
ncbi:MAG: class I SAM-dependent methyltransferase [Rhodospirillum sp.]|nr:class I SAM-dependent methyltransferase [Rhodospirillum sp.]MCF8491791.1 class I SAM-dependent methyltransferase [Rhodospirillum sp.]MCF8503102.1 class I SAM-dependent methyltransferase [Rhodospirillum sp.]